MVRIVIVDWDFHHGNTIYLYCLHISSCHILGNGSQTIWYADNRVLYISLHRWTSYFPPVFDLVVMTSICSYGDGVYPGGDLGASDKTGEEDGLAFNLNFPFTEAKIENIDYTLSFEAALLAIKVNIW